MSYREKVEEILDKAKEQESNYSWAKAAALYEQALPMVGKREFLRRGKLQERIGRCLYRAAFQIDIEDEFRSRIQHAIKACKEAHAIYEKVCDGKKNPILLRNEAFIKYLCYWVSSQPVERRKLLDECLELESKVLKEFSESADMRGYGGTYSELPLVFWLRAELEWDGQIKKNIYEKGIEWGENAVAALCKMDAPHELAKSYYALSSCLTGSRVFAAGLERQEEIDLKIVGYLQKALDLFRTTNDFLFLGLSNCLFYDRAEADEVEKHSEEALRYGEMTRDNLLIGWSLSLKAYITFMKAYEIESPTKKREEIIEKSFPSYDRAHRIYSFTPIAFHCFGLVSFPFGYIHYYLEMANGELTREKKLEFVKKAEKAGTEGLCIAKASDLPLTIVATLDYLCRTYEYRAQLESDTVKKRHYLEMSLKFIERANQIRKEQTHSLTLIEELP